MSTSTAPSGSPHRLGPETEGSPWAAGGSALAGVLMVLYGVLGVLQGIAGIAKNDVYGNVGDYVFKLDTTAWGWIHLILGAIVLAAGFGIFKGALWARSVGVALATLTVIANFMWLPYYPVWAIIGIALGVFVIWALCTDRFGAAA
ncbi:hypothetical protein G5C51_10430 [Streptomyces sp. A7024]|uniref:DUF7144 domain-containing protein n=1 Tax=Streptomyces coryli TaxID=1128680 RepID=A0A6G4TYW7_9ACTN|nr:hypothetical protein [Streptomyces coryli]NGN64318.1 hypothetical protein [Streptomyces coryli]